VPIELLVVDTMNNVIIVAQLDTRHLTNFLTDTRHMDSFLTHSVFCSAYHRLVHTLNSRLSSVT
jgi:hypothetical protein